MNIYEEPATPRSETSGTDEAGRCCRQQEKGCKTDQKGGREGKEDPQALPREQERERLARWLRAGEVWLP